MRVSGVSRWISFENSVFTFGASHAVPFLIGLTAARRRRYDEQRQRGNSYGSKPLSKGATRKGCEKTCPKKDPAFAGPFGARVVLGFRYCDGIAGSRCRGSCRACFDPAPS